MKILFDQGTPVPLRRFLGDHEIVTAFELGWGTLQNGELLPAAEAEVFSPLSPPIGISVTSKTCPPAGLRCSS